MAHLSYFIYLLSSRNSDRSLLMNLYDLNLDFISLKFQKTKNYCAPASSFPSKVLIYSRNICRRFPFIPAIKENWKTLHLCNARQLYLVAFKVLARFRDVFNFNKKNYSFRLWSNRINFFLFYSLAVSQSFLVWKVLSDKNILGQ